MNNSTSHTFLPEAKDPAAAEFSSYYTLTNNLRKHTRTELSPIQKFHRDKVASHAVGWGAEDDNILKSLRHPAHGITESKVTKRYVDMKSTGVESCLRICK